MAKPLIVTLAGQDFPLALNRVERSDLYGYVEHEAVDEKGRKCVMASLAEDGKSVIGPGGSSLVTLSPDGNWLEKKSLVPVDTQGNRITPVASSYSAPVPLTEKASVDEYLSHNVRSVYQIGSEADLGPLLAELKAGVIFKFPYSFRGGLEPDAGFLLLAADGTPFLAIGTPTKLEFVGFDESAGIAASDEETEEDDDDLDFGMM